MTNSIGKYKIEKLLGKGAMGEVYLGYDEILDRPVAIKVLQGSQEFTTAFLAEARLCAKLDHPNILKIFELGKVEDSGRLYCAMQYIDGGSLTELMKSKGTLSEMEVVSISKGVLSGLHCAHKGGIIHRDIKPDNILFDRNGFPIIADFGIAQNLNNVFTLNKQIIGTPEYMSPEQAQGLDLNNRTDIYSFGVVMFQMATGRLPFYAETPLELALKHVNDTAPSPLAANQAMNPELAKIIIKSMKKDRLQRYSDASAILADLAALEKGVQNALQDDVPPKTPAEGEVKAFPIEKTVTANVKKTSAAAKLISGKVPPAAVLASTECPRCGMSKKFGMPYCITCTEELESQNIDDSERNSLPPEEVITGSGTYIDNKKQADSFSANQKPSAARFFLRSADGSISFEVRGGDIVGRCCQCKSDAEKKAAVCRLNREIVGYIDCQKYNAVSRKHVQFFFENGQLYVMALSESKNVTALNNFELEKEKKYKLCSGDKLQISSQLVLIFQTAV